MLTKSQVKYIQSLNEKKFRQENGVFVAEGPKMINELLSAPGIYPVALYATEQWWNKNDAIKIAFPSLVTHEVTGSELEKISFVVTPNQVLGLFKLPVFAANISFNDSISLLLDGIQDPGNFGTIVRIADWFGIKQIVASNDCVDVYNPKTVQSTMGSIARVNILYEDLSGFLKEHVTIPVYASTLHGKPVSEYGKIREGMLLIGNESRGISEALLQASHHEITIPKIGHAESLNAAVATGIILSHIM